MKIFQLRQIFNIFNIFLVSIFFVYPNISLSSERTCEYLLYENFFDDTYTEPAENFGFFLEDVEDNDDNYIEIIDILNSSPLSELEIDLDKDPTIISINGINLVLNNEEEFSDKAKQLENILNDNEFIEFEIYYLDNEQKESFELNKFSYEKEIDVTATININELKVINKSRETTGKFFIQLKWDNPEVTNKIEAITANNEYVCYFDTQDSIEKVLNKVWSPIPESDELGSKYEIAKLNLLTVRNFNDDYYQFTLDFEMDKTVRNKTNLGQFPFDTLETKFDFVFKNGGSVYNYYETDEEDIESLNNNLLEWEIQKDFKEYFKKVGSYDASYFEFDIKRKNLYYIFKIMLPVIFIVLISFSVFWINNQEIEGKLNVSIVSLLALIAYNFVYGSDLPKIGSITVMDTFILIAYLFAGLSTFISVYSYFDYRRDKLKSDFNTLDLKMRYIAPIGYAIAVSSICLIVYGK